MVVAGPHDFGDLYCWLLLALGAVILTSVVQTLQEWVEPDERTKLDIASRISHT